MSERWSQVRVEELITEVIDGGVLIYDRRSDEAHWLEPEAAAVWSRCAGGCAMDEIAARTGLTESVAADVLERLAALDLVESDCVPSAERVNRRVALRRIALTGGALAGSGMVASIIAPTNAFAYTCASTNTWCNVPCSSSQDGQSLSVASTDCPTGNGCTGNCNGVCQNYGSYTVYGMCS